jgi:methylglutaconyl-CoA hydratase
VRVRPLHCALVAADLVKVDGDGAVRTLTLDSPHNRNALSSGLLDELGDAFRNATSDDAVRVIVLTGTGTVFCSGADLSESGEFRTSRMEAMLTLMASARVPVIARVNGHARAGGLGLMAVSDLAVAARGSTFAFSKVRVGVAPAMILVPALAVVERRFLARTMLTGESFSAEEAASAGLLSDVVDDEDGLDRWVHHAVDAILKSAPGAVSATKSLLASMSEMSFAEGLATASRRSAELFAGAEAAEGMDAFLHKRRPSWDVSAP